MRTPLVAGNWKMHGSQAANGELLTAVRRAGEAARGVETAVFPPAVYLAQAQQALAGSPVAWGAQNVSDQAGGAFTGEVSVDMLRDFACRYVIVGHSERRALYGESDALVAEKSARVCAAGLVPIVCVGETLAERERGDTLAVVERQLACVTQRLGAESCLRIVVAYEPVWAIGTGRTASPEQAQEVHAAIRRQLREVSPAVGDAVRILYGGSVKPANAAEIFSKADVDGGLIGGASLVAADFLAIAAAAERVKR